MKDRKLILDAEQAKKSIANHKVDLSVGIVDSLNLTTLFTLFLDEVLTRFLEETARFILFPIAGAAAVIRAGLAWRQARIDYKNGSIGAEVWVETVAALAISTAIIGGFVATAIFATVAPIIFAVTMAAKSLFNFGAACYYLGKSMVESEDEDKKQGYRDAAYAYAVGALAGTLATIAVTAVMILAKPLMAVFGIAAGFIGMVFTAYKLIKKPSPAAEYKTIPVVSENEEEKKSSLDQHKKLGRTNSADLLRRFPVDRSISSAPVVSTKLTSRPEGSFLTNSVRVPSILKEEIRSRSFSV